MGKRKGQRKDYNPLPEPTRDVAQPTHANSSASAKIEVKTATVSSTKSPDFTVPVDRTPATGRRGTVSQQLKAVTFELEHTLTNRSTAAMPVQFFAAGSMGGIASQWVYKYTGAPNPDKWASLYSRSFALADIFASIMGTAGFVISMVGMAKWANSTKLFARQSTTALTENVDAQLGFAAAGIEDLENLTPEEQYAFKIFATQSNPQILKEAYKLFIVGMSLFMFVPPIATALAHEAQSEGFDQWYWLSGACFALGSTMATFLHLATKLMSCCSPMELPISLKVQAAHAFAGSYLGAKAAEEFIVKHDVQRASSQREARALIPAILGALFALIPTAIILIDSKINKQEDVKLMLQGKDPMSFGQRLCGWFRCGRKENEDEDVREEKEDALLAKGEGNSEQMPSSPVVEHHSSISTPALP